jgi:hypothetical protein
MVGKTIDRPNPFLKIVALKTGFCYIATMAKQIIKVDGKDISIKQVSDSDYLSLTDMTKAARPDQRTDDIIRNWLRNSATVRFLEVWEQYNNPDFNSAQMDGIKIALADDRETITAKRFIEATNAIGIQSKAGRYGGTYAHVDIAFEFASWLSPEFKYFVIRDYQRLKTDEAQKLNPAWDVRRLLSKINYSLQTESIKQNILPRLEGKTPDGLVFATEADLLNYVVFGLTAREWKERHPEKAKNGNLRDFASLPQLTVLSNLESYNAELIRLGISQESRLLQLLGMAQFQLQIFQQEDRLRGIED